MDERLAAYLAFTTVLVITPGSATAVVVRNVLDGGPRRGIAAALGAAAGNTAYAVLSGLGLAALFARVPVLFLLLRLTGAAYLAFLGARSLRAAGLPTPPALPGALERAGVSTPGAAPAGFSEGLGNNLLNPAVATFYLAVVPSFLDGGAAPTAQYAMFAAIHIAMAFAYHSTWVMGLHAMRAFWSRPGARRLLETLTGIALLLLAARILL